MKQKTWYMISKPAPDGRLNTCGFQITDGQSLKFYCRSKEDITRLEAVQAYGYEVNEVRNPKKKAGPQT